ncbi:MAG: ComF family protein [Magnetococcales bacterium]|nr:ComF family protein [Magnetococcales bacterium]
MMVFRWGQGLRRRVQRFAPVVNDVLDLLFPKFCPVCGTHVTHPRWFCRDCFRSLPPMPEQHCLRCGGTTSEPVWGCGLCLHEGDLPDRVYFPFCYLDSVAEIIVGFKFFDHTEWASGLADLAMERVGIDLMWEDVALVVPVPLHPSRLLWRGYNQSALLAGVMARRLDRPLVTHGLHRIRRTRPQVRLRQDERRSNVQDAFLARRDVIGNRSVLLVDDVFTTGSTVWAATRALKKGGATRVVVCCLARVDH